MQITTWSQMFGKRKLRSFFVSYKTKVGGFKTVTVQAPSQFDAEILTAERPDCQRIRPRRKDGRLF